MAKQNKNSFPYSLSWIAKEMDYNYYRLWRARKNDPVEARDMEILAEGKQRAIDAIRKELLND